MPSPYVMLHDSKKGTQYFNTHTEWGNCVMLDNSAPSFNTLLFLQQQIKHLPRPGIESGSPAWQAGILTTILPRNLVGTDAKAFITNTTLKQTSFCSTTESSNPVASAEAQIKPTRAESPIRSIMSREDVQREILYKLTRSQKDLRSHYLKEDYAYLKATHTSKGPLHYLKATTKRTNCFLRWARSQTLPGNLSSILAIDFVSCRPRQQHWLAIAPGCSHFSLVVEHTPENLIHTSTIPSPPLPSLFRITNEVVICGQLMTKDLAFPPSIELFIHLTWE